MNELQQQAYAQRLEVHDTQHGYIESRRVKARLQEELSMKEKALRDTQIRRMRGMGEMKRAQELRVVEISWHKLRENYETIQKLTSQLQGGIKLQWEIVWRFQSTRGDSKFSLHAEPRQTLSSWDMESIRITGKRFGNNFLRLIHPEIILKELTFAQQENKDQFHRLQGRWLFFARDYKQNKGTIPLPTFAGRPSTSSSLIPVDIPQNSMVGQQRQQISELQFDKFWSTIILGLGDTIQKSSDYLWDMLHHKWSMVHLTICTDSASVVLSLLHICSPCHSLVRTPDDSSNVLTLAQACLSHTRTRDIVICLSLPVLIFHRMQCYGSKRSGDGWFIGRIEVLAISLWKEFSTNWSRCWTRKLLLQFKKKVSLEEQKAQKEEGFPRGRQIAFMIYDYFSSDWRSWHSTRLSCFYSPLHFMKIIFRNSMQDGMKYYYLCRRFHPMISWKVCTNWELTCSPVRNIFRRISSHDLPCRRTMRKCLLQIFSE